MAKNLGLSLDFFCVNGVVFEVGFFFQRLEVELIKTF